MNMRFSEGQQELWVTPVQAIPSPTGEVSQGLNTVSRDGYG